MPWKEGKCDERTRKQLIAIQEIHWDSCENDFTDVTLVCEDAKQVNAHKVFVSHSYTHIISALGELIFILIF